MALNKRELFFILFLVVLTISLRLVPIYPSYFPFMYDHAKDELIIMQMGTTFKPSLIGAVTSIPGVYYGPLWYYLALPLNILMGYNPLASVLTVIILSVISVLVVYKYAGKLAAIWYATSFGLIGTQSSAWSPYMTPLVVLPVLLILLKQKKKKPIATKELLLLALFTSLCFHFQPAYAVVLTPLVVVALVLLKLKITWQQLLLAVLVFLMPFAPHLLFELRHDFHQTKQVINFIQHYREQANTVQPNQKGLGRLVEINTYMIDTIGKAVSPIEVPFVAVGYVVIGGMIGTLLWKMKSKKKTFKQVRLTDEEWIVYGTVLIGTFLLYLVLPAKSYYFVAILPAIILLVARFVEQQYKKLVPLVMIFLVGLAIWQARQNYVHNRVLAETETFMLQPKLAAIQKVKELLKDGPYKIYSYVPEIYDYTYQSLFSSYRPPVEFSYAPGEKAYMEQLVPNLMQSKRYDDKPFYTSVPTFLIVEKPVYDWAYDEWWNRVASDLEIDAQYPINEAITVYEAHQKIPL